MGLCKSRQAPAAAAAKQLVNKQQIASKDTRKASEKAWARLREEAPLNPGAEPFVPPPKQPQPREDAATEAQRGRPPTTGLQPHVLPSLCLQGEAHRLTAKQVRARRPDPVRGVARQQQQQQQQPQPQLQPQPGGALKPCLAANFVLRTDEYKSLLQTASGGNSREEGGAKISVQNMAPWRRDKHAPSMEPVATVPPAKSAAGLGQLVANAFLEPTTKANTTDAISVDTEGMLCTKTRQFLDDTFLERFLDDRDFSEQAYWSDGGEGKLAPHGRSALIPSAHHFCRPEDQNRATRSYVMQDLSEDLDQATALLLGQLQFFQQLKVLDPVCPQRRFFIGLKEVFRRMRQGIVKVLIVAPDLEGSAINGDLDNRMREVLAYSYKNEVPVIFALTRKRIGRALGKNLNFSIVGLVDVTGARELCDNALGLAQEQRLAWLDRIERERRNSTPLW